jgi:hypothetical protein
METIDFIIKVAAFLSALGIIVAAAVKVIRVANKVKNSVDGFNTSIEDLKEHANENYMGVLRLTIMSNEMPIGERIVAGHKYLKKGGNGEVKKFLKEKFNIDDPVNEASHYKA